ncbi:MAG: putative FtsJ-like methyltransferase [Satyrvirus sp.]|uniref:Putative FtsJ-like methyltransferase n=1 Tax=Satyrvirus sp. TaxID=2487771 RepID=A0A3G5AHT3_9VIRU|nr:MAG: putative FtsJ-like methyltransferase [Satyrvirus sp.]
MYSIEDLNKIQNKAKALANDIKVDYESSIFYFNTKLYSVSSSDINLVKKNKIKFIEFIGSVHKYISTNVINPNDITIMEKPTDEKPDMHMILNQKLLNEYGYRIQKMITDEVRNCYNKYLKLYRGCTTFSQFQEKNNLVSYMEEQELYSDNKIKNDRIIYEQINERIRQLKNCSEIRGNEDPFYKILYEHDKELIDSKKSLSYNNDYFCNHVLWGSEMMLSDRSEPKCVKILDDKTMQEMIDGTILAEKYYMDHLPDHVKQTALKDIADTTKGKYFMEDELMLETIGQGNRQYVFGYSIHINKYKQCPKYFICGTMKRPLPGMPACAEFADWSRKLNTLYTQCAAKYRSQFIRFVMPPDYMLPQKMYDNKDISDFSIFNKLPVAVMVTKFEDDREFRKTKHKTETLYHYIFFDIDSDLEYKSMYEMGMLPVPTRLKIYSSSKRETVIGQIWYSKLITYNEFMILFVYNKVDHVYRSKKYKYILFLSHTEVDPKKINEMNLEKVDLKYKLVREFYGPNPITRTYIFYDKQRPEDLIFFRLALNEKHIFLYKKMEPEQYMLTNEHVRPRAMKELGLKGMEGGHNLDISIKLEDRSKNNLYGFFDEGMADKYIFGKILKLNVSSAHLETDDEKLYFYFSRFLDPHMLVDSVNISARRRITEFTYTFDRFYRKVIYEINRLLDFKQVHKYLTIYRPLTDKFFNRYEIISQYNLVNDNSSIIVYGNSSLSDVEAINYYSIKNGIKKNNIFVVYHPKISIHKNDFDQKINHLKRFFKFEIEKNSSLLDVEFLSNSHYGADIILDDYTIRPINDKYNEYYHLRLKMACSLFALKNLKQDGYFVLFIMNIFIKTYADLVLILAQYFKRYELYNYEIQAKYKFISAVVIFIGYKGIDNSEFKKILSLYEDTIKYGPDIFSTNIDVVNEQNFIVSLVNKNITDEIYEPFKNFNNKILAERYGFLDDCYRAVKNPFIVKKLEQNMIFESLKYIKKYDFDMIDFMGIDRSENFLELFLREIYFKLEPLSYTFLKNTEFVDLKIQGTVTLNTKPKIIMENDAGRIALTDIIIDTRNISEWYSLKQHVRYFRPFVKFDLDLRKYIIKNYNVGNISQAWLKMYEIIANIPLFDENNCTIKTFHICEAPGSFILAINHYIRTNTNIKKFHWIANSLKPTSQHAHEKSKTAFGDDYGLMKKYPKNWDFGIDGTGDITHRENIDYYKKIIKDVDFITSDCGIPLESIEGDEMLRIHITEFILIMEILPKGANFVAKFFFPLHRTLEYHLLYLLFSVFEELIFYKSKVNIFSKEFYIIGKKYLGKDAVKKSINYDTVDSAFDFLTKLIDKDKFNSNNKIYTNIKIPASFLEQLSVVNKKLIDDYIFNFKKQLFYVDNHEELNKKFIEQIKSSIKRKNLDWCKDNKLRPISDKDKL